MNMLIRFRVNISRKIVLWCRWGDGIGGVLVGKWLVCCVGFVGKI